MTDANVFTCRYAETGNRFTLHRWGVHQPRRAKAAFPFQGTLDERPQWLVEIVLAAKMGRHGRAVGYPPPDFIAWFDITADYKLIEFSEFGDLA